VRTWTELNRRGNVKSTSRLRKWSGGGNGEYRQAGVLVVKVSFVRFLPLRFEFFGIGFLLD
jgi:hypothetical protein